MRIKRVFLMAASIVGVLSAFQAHAQKKPEKLRIGYAARAVAH